MFEGLKDTLTDIDGNPPSTLEKLIAGGIAGAFSQTITYPLDVLRRRMQVASMSNLDYHYSGAWDCVFKMIKYEGEFLRRCVQAIPTERVLIEILIL
jgi:solute carrier family 25 phosphate transporter 23/24/25/41